jgi:isopentenyl-diphosphate delta-isomerase
VETGNGKYSPIKDAHLRVCLEHHVESVRTTGLETLSLAGDVPDFTAPEMDTTVRFLGKTLSLPLLIAPITGGGSLSGLINRHLAEAAERCRIGMAVGSERPMLEKRVGAESYLVREWAPTVPLLANLGLVHVRRGRDYLLEAIESIRADGIILYVNPLHEILQSDGEKDFTGALEALAEVVAAFPYPVFLKEVGCGLPDSIVRWASTIQIAGVDVAGLGGTNWPKVEGLIQGRDYSLYEGLGTGTRDAIIGAAKRLREGQYLIGSGGIRTGLDMAKALALGAHLTSMALPFLRWARESAGEVVRGVDRLREELLVCLWYTGSRTISALRGKVTGESRC